MIPQETIDEEIKKFKEAQLKKITEQLVQTGELEPIISILGYDYQEKTFEVINIPVGEGMTDEQHKSVLFKVAIPKLFDFFTENNRRVICFSFSCEAWFRTVEGKDGKPAVIPKDIKSLPKTEALIVSFESENHGDVVIYDMSRTGAKITLNKREDMGNTTFKGNVPELFRKHYRSKYN